MRFKNFIRKIFSLNNFISFFGILLFLFLIYALTANKTFILLFYILLILAFIFTLILVVINDFVFKETHKLIKYFFMFIYLFNIITISCTITYIIADQINYKCTLAYTNDDKIASDIKNMNNHITINSYSHKYNIKLPYGSRNYRDEIIIKIAEKYQSNDNIEIIGEFINYDKNAKSNWEKSLSRVIGKIDGVSKVNVNITKFGEENEDIEMDINVTVKGRYNKKIEKIINNLIYYKIKRNINISYE